MSHTTAAPTAKDPPKQNKINTMMSLVVSLLVLWSTTASINPVQADETTSSSSSSCSAVDSDVTTTTCQNKNHQQNARMQCGVYMAPSTLGEATSMGIFTGMSLKENDVINFPEIAVPILFRGFDSHPDGFDDGVLWDRYIWEGEIMDIEPYKDFNRKSSKSVFVPGVGCTVNSVLDMHNINSTHGSIYDQEGLHRSKDPGVGAFAPYHGAKTTVAVQELPPGAELFASYGDYWIPDIPGAQITLDPNLDEAKDFLHNSYFPFIQDNDDRMDEELKQALWEFTTNDFPIFSPAMTNMPRKVPWSAIEQELKGGNDDVVRHFIRNQSIRDLDWLEEHGYCQDHLIPKKSTIPQAGRGAFAYRDLPEGTVVGFAPMVHIGLYGKDVFKVKVETDPPHEKQDLILNYSFGHPNSTVLLTPYGGMVNYINHSKEKANIKLRWPDKEQIAHKPWYLETPPERLSDIVDKIGLSLEYVAARDIMEGEEVFLDYGEAWEKAWNEHVTTWQPVENAEAYIHSTEWNETSFRTTKEQEENPYPSNLITMCQESYTYNMDEDVNYWIDVLRDGPYRVYCSILERNDDDHTYTVHLKLRKGGTAVVHGVPEDKIYLYDKAFSNDWHLANVFRHEIGLPDDIVPNIWRNKNE